MAARCIEILKDDEHRREMGRAGRRRAAALFSADRVVSQYERLYERALAGSGVRP
jgi:glycosyltransferase involved in cell wall biosynthesis